MKRKNLVYVALAIFSTAAVAAHAPASSALSQQARVFFCEALTSDNRNGYLTARPFSSTLGVSEITNQWKNFLRNVGDARGTLFTQTEYENCMPFDNEDQAMTKMMENDEHYSINLRRRHVSIPFRPR